jgi:hypothetical protein
MCDFVALALMLTKVARDETRKFCVRLDCGDYRRPYQ